MTMVIPKLSRSADQLVPGATTYTITLQGYQRPWYWIVPSATGNSYILGPPHERLLVALQTWVTLDIFFYSLPPPLHHAEPPHTSPVTNPPAGSLQGLTAGYWNFGVGDKDADRELERIGTAVVRLLREEEAWLTSPL